MVTAKRLSPEKDVDPPTVPKLTSKHATPSDQLLNEQNSASPIQNGNDLQVEDEVEELEQQDELDQPREQEEIGEEEVEKQEEEAYGDAVEEEQPNEEQISDGVLWAAALASRIGLGAPVDELNGAHDSTDYDNVLDLLSNDNWLSVDASLQLKVQSLPILDNLVNYHPFYPLSRATC